MATILTRIFGSANERTIKRLWPLVEEISRLEDTYRALPDSAFPAKTAEWMAQVTAEEVTLDDILPEAFAAVREAARRTIGLRHYDVQCLGGIVLHQGTHRGDEDRRGQDAGRHPAALPERAHRQGRAPGHGERLPGAPRRPVDGPGLPLPRPVGGLDHPRHQLPLRPHLHPQGLPLPPPARRSSGATPTGPTSPTARTTSSASTTCATT